MKEVSVGRNLTFDDIRRLNSRVQLARFFGDQLNYKIINIASSPDVLGIPAKTAEQIKEVYLFSDYDKAFQVYLFEMANLNLGPIRSVSEMFFRKHPAGDYLFIFTKGYEQFSFVSPDRIFSAENGSVKIKLSRLNVERETPYHTDLQILQDIRLPHPDAPPDQIYARHQQAFNIERVTEQFFKGYKLIFDRLKAELAPQKDVRSAHAFAHQLLNRLMFLYFIQKRGWLVGDKKYIPNLYERYTQNRTKPQTFYSEWFSSLFFGAFNKKFGFQNANLLREVKDEFSRMPYLNGGLFTMNHLDEQGFKVRDETIKAAIFDLLERYNFTVEESKPLDVEVAVDDEMLGKVYESLVLEEERHRSGIFYTPRVEIDMMCRQSLIEYLAGKTNISRPDIIALVWADSSEAMPKLSPGALNIVDSALENVAVVDPACGSGAFLVGMMNVLVEIRRHIANLRGREFNTFETKKHIIERNLFGVDIKDWAVRVAELRLWLKLMIEADESEFDLYSEPLLPNLSFKIKQGDSLVEEISGVSVSLRGEFSRLSSNIKSEIKRFAKAKADFYNNRPSLSEFEILRLEREILRRIIDKRVAEINREIQSLTEPTVKPEQTQLDIVKPTAKQLELEIKAREREEEKRKRKLEDLRSQKATLMQAYDAIGIQKTKDYFFWEIDFSEIFEEKGGFDIVIGNPPYVRQEEIARPTLLPEEVTLEIKKDYKDKLARSVLTHWKDVKIDRRSDYYVYFYYHGLALLRRGGTFCFITSNSWLDVGYGVGLQKFLLENIEIEAIYDNQVKRSFKSADINTVIVVFRRAADKRSLPEHRAKFVAFKKPFEQVLSIPNLQMIDETQETKKTEDFQAHVITQRDLLLDGMEIEESEQEKKFDFEVIIKGRYVGSKWGGKYLRAPDIFFRILEKGKGRLVRLGDIAEVRRGFTTGANEFFFVREVKMERSQEISSSKIYNLDEREFSKIVDQVRSKKLCLVQPSKFGLNDNDATYFLVESECLHPAVQKVEEVTSYSIKDVTKKLFSPPISRLVNLPYAKKYIEWGEDNGFHETETCKARSKWWFLLGDKKKEPSFVGFNYNIYDTGRFYYSPDFPVYFSDNFHMIYADSPEIITAIGNSTLFILFVNVFARRMFGGGKVKLQTYELQRMPFINPGCIDSKELQQLRNGWSKLSERAPSSVFQELGFDPSLSPTQYEPQVLPDRRFVDQIVFETLGLTDSEHVEIYKATSEMIRNRFRRAESV